VPKAPDEKRLIIATCEKGTVEDVDAMREIKKGIEAQHARYPNLVETWAKKIFLPTNVDIVADAPPRPSWHHTPRRRSALAERAERIKARGKFRIGMPRVLNMYSAAPFFLGYFESLGLDPRNLVWSDYTSENLYRDGAKRGSIDPCFPSKVCIPHVHNLLFHKHKEAKPLDAIFFPMIDTLPTFLHAVQDSRSCPTVCASPESVHAAFIKEADLFAERGIAFKKTFVNLHDAPLTARQMFEDWAALLGVTEEESRRAVAAGLGALERFNAARQAEARALLEELEREQRLGIVLLARPYHSDPGINHEICAEFQKLGYPVFAQESLPQDRDIVERVFAEDLASGRIRDPFDIDDVWKNSYSEHTSRKIWAAKFVARHPNLVALELSSFKCGHDAPIYSVVEEIVERSGTPFFYFKDIDENKPSGSIKIRVETIAYFLERRRERLLAEAETRQSIERRLEDYEKRLRTRETESVSVA
jgi:predicted nucleotide-binding protein (sugar kinase/HSP70/actin superfamily)